MNKEPQNTPTAWWKIIAGTILLAVIFVSVPITRNDYNIAHLVLFFVLGAICFLFWCFIAGLAKKPTPWMRQNIGLIAKIGGLITAASVLWSILSKK
jgi:hypothetical protein